MASFSFTARADVIRAAVASLHQAVNDTGDKQLVTITVDDTLGANHFTVTDPSGGKKNH